VRAYLTLRLDRPGCLRYRCSGARHREKLCTVRARVGQSQDAVRGAVAGRRLIEVAADGIEVEREPAGEVAQPGNVAAEFLLPGRCENFEAARQRLGVPEPALAHRQISGPQARGALGRPVRVFPDMGEDVQRRLGVKSSYSRRTVIRRR
jgi:hypothetical protein